MSINHKYILYIISITLGIWMIVHHLNNSEKSHLAYNFRFTEKLHGQTIVAKQFDDFGVLRRSIEAISMTHDHDGKSIFHEPVVTLYKEGQPPWIITAKKGYAYNDFKEITLKDEVHMSQDKGPHNTQTIITTNSITYIPGKNMAHTKDHIQIKQKGRSIESIGLKAYLNEERVELLSHTRGYYEQT